MEIISQNQAGISSCEEMSYDSSVTSGPLTVNSTEHSQDSHPTSNNNKGLILLPVPDPPSTSSLLSGKSIILHRQFADSLSEKNKAEISNLQSKISGNVDLDEPNKPISIYHLLLDAQLELSSDGDRIVCSKPADQDGIYPSNKRRRKSLANEHSFHGDSNASLFDKEMSFATLASSAMTSPTATTKSGMHNNNKQDLSGASPAPAAPRPALISLQETALNSGESNRINKFFSTHCHSDCVLTIDLNALGARHGLNGVCIYREIRGARGIASYFAATMQTIPDAITLYWPLKNLRLSDGGREIQAKTLMVGRQVYELDVVHDEEAHCEQEDLQWVVAGLTSLASACKQQPPVSPSHDTLNVSTGHHRPLTATNGFDMSQSQTDRESTDTSSNNSTNNNNNSPVMTNDSERNERKRSVRSLKSMNILVTEGSVEFLCGKPLEQSLNVNYGGVTTWTLDKDKKITKLHFVLM